MAGTIRAFVPFTETRAARVSWCFPPPIRGSASRATPSVTAWIFSRGRPGALSGPSFTTRWTAPLSRRPVSGGGWDHARPDLPPPAHHLEPVGRAPRASPGAGNRPRAGALGRRRGTLQPGDREGRCQAKPPGRNSDLREYPKSHHTFWTRPRPVRAGARGHSPSRRSQRQSTTRKPLAPLLVTPHGDAPGFGVDRRARKIPASLAGLQSQLVRPDGIEPPTRGLGNLCSIH